MTKLLTSCALILISNVAVKADNIRLTSGKYLDGRVFAYTNSNFQVEFENHSVTNLRSQTVRTIDFDDELVQSLIESTVQSETKGKVSLYDKGALSVENEDGLVNRIPLQLIAKVTFGEPSTAPVEPPKKETPKTEAVKQVNIPKIEQVDGPDLSKHIVHGKVTIVDFYADWCGPCRSIGPYLEELTQKNDAVILRRVNIDKNQELAAKFGISAIPNIIIYDKSGNEIGTVRGANRDRVGQLVASASTGN